jgi:hypothetical protein
METEHAMSGIIELSYKERSELERVLKSCTKSKVYQRAQALLLLDEGEVVERVAELLRVSHTVAVRTIWCGALIAPKYKMLLLWEVESA